MENHILMSGPESCMFKVIGSCRGKFAIVHCNMICFLMMQSINFKRIGSQNSILAQNCFSYQAISLIQISDDKI